MSEYGEGDYCPVNDSEWRRARKEHRCDACGETIAPGHQYHRTAQLYDGRWSAWARCVRCQAIFEHLSDRIDAEGSRYDDEYCNPELNCGHTYKERWNEDPPEWLAALAFWRPGDPLPEKAKPQP